MSSVKRLVIVAGEESGDIHAASLAQALLEWDKTLSISGIGGKHMQDAGVHLISDLARFGVTGFSEVIRHAWVIKKAFTQIKTHLKRAKPDLLILVDYPGFNLRLAKFAKKILGIRVLYFISPQIWAWKANRIKTIQAYVDRMAVILPFEKSIYQQAKVPVSFVGHPLVSRLPSVTDTSTTRRQFNLPLNKQLIALLPGSRINEIKKLMPILVKTVELLHQQNSNLHFVIPIAKSLELNTVKSYFKKIKAEVTFTSGHAVEIMACSDCVVVASGTASLECALLNKPMCIIYKLSLLTHIAATQLLKVKYVGLCNLLLHKMVAPELLQQDCNPIELAKVVHELLTNQDTINYMAEQLSELKHSLSTNQADCTLIELVKTEMKFKKIE